MSAFTRRAVVFPLVSSLSLLLLAGCGPAADEVELGSEAVFEDNGELESELGLAKRAAVFTLSNEAKNEVLAFRRGEDGRLTPAGRIPTGGMGSAAGLGSQGALALSSNGRWLLAVNAGSNQVSVFWVIGTALYLTDVVQSGGLMPISVTIQGHLVYVLNAGGAGNVTGFRLDCWGRLERIASATQPLSTRASGPAQVSLTADRRTLVVTEKATNSITTYAVREDGSLGLPAVTPSSGQTPFGFALTSDGTLVVSEAVGAMPNLGTVSSYRVGGGVAPGLVSASVQTGQTAPCWVAITGDDAYAYSANTPAGTITGFAIDTAGGLSLLASGGATAATGEGSRPTDLTLSRGSRFLYVLEAGTHRIGAYQVQWNGALAPVQAPGADGLPASTVGMVAL